MNSINAMIGNERHCAICDRTFIMRPEWVYKRGFGKGSKVFCSWHCLREYEKRHLTGAARREFIVRMLREGKGVSEISTALAIDPRSVYYWKQKLALMESDDE